LADGLKVGECSALRLIVQKALGCEDSKFAYKFCKTLMEKDYPDIWPECYQLASVSTFTDLDAR